MPIRFLPGAAAPGALLCLPSSTALSQPAPAPALAPADLPDVTVTAPCPDVQGYAVRRDGEPQGGATRTDTPFPATSFLGTGHP